MTDSPSAASPGGRQAARCGRRGAAGPGLGFDGDRLSAAGGGSSSRLEAGCRKAAPGIWAWRCMSWPPMQLVMAPGMACGGLWVAEDTVRCEVTDDGPPKLADGTDAGPRDMALWPVEPGHALWRPPSR